MILDLLSTLEENKYLYIDLNDIRINKNTILNNLDIFLREYSIEVLVIENIQINKKLIESLKEMVDILIFSSNNYQFIEKFNHIEVKPLDFEEFLLFDNSYSNVTQSFNHFLKHGNMPYSFEFDEDNKIKRLQQYIKLMSKDETELMILRTFIKSMGQTKSILQLFNSLKKEIKISKDRFYSYCNYLEDSRIIVFLPKFNQPRSVKKIYTFNFVLSSAISFQKNFNNIFNNIVFCELKNRFENIYYLDGVDFYIPKINTIVLSIPFFNEFQIENKKRLLLDIIEEHNIKEIYIITISSDFTFDISNINCKVEPFYQWALE